MPIIIYKFIFFTTLKKQLTFVTQLINHTIAAMFKAGGLKNLLAACTIRLSYLAKLVSATQIALAIKLPEKFVETSNANSLSFSITGLFSELFPTIV